MCPLSKWSAGGGGYAVAAWEWAPGPVTTGTSSVTISTVPLPPSTMSLSPVLMVVEALPVPVTAGRSYSRQTMVALLIMPTISVTVALILPQIGPQLGAVIGATRISPGWI